MPDKRLTHVFGVIDKAKLQRSMGAVLWTTGLPTSVVIPDNIITSDAADTSEPVIHFLSRQTIPPSL